MPGGRHERHMSVEKRPGLTAPRIEKPRKTPRNWSHILIFVSYETFDMVPNPYSVKEARQKVVWRCLHVCASGSQN